MWQMKSSSERTFAMTILVSAVASVLLAYAASASAGAASAASSLSPACQSLKASGPDFTSTFSTSSSSEKSAIRVLSPRIEKRNLEQLQAFISAFVAKAPAAAKPHGAHAERGLEEIIRVLSGTGWDAKELSSLPTTTVKAYGNGVVQFFGGILWLGMWASTACAPATS
jgi:hypothetical protein